MDGVWHFLGQTGEQDLENRMTAGRPSLLITGTRNSFVIDLDWQAVHDTSTPNDHASMNDFTHWARNMILFVDRKLTQELISGTQDFIRNSRVWLKPNQRNYTLFFLGADGDDVVFAPVPGSK